MKSRLEFTSRSFNYFIFLLPIGMASLEQIRAMESGWQRAPDLIERETEQRFKPCFVTKPEAQVVNEGEMARFVCRVTGYPKPRVMWLLNGHTVINVSSFIYSLNLIKINTVLYWRMFNEVFEVFCYNIYSVVFAFKLQIWALYSLHFKLYYITMVCLYQNDTTSLP